MWLWWQQESARFQPRSWSTSADHAVLMVLLIIFIAAVGLAVAGSLAFYDQVVPGYEMS